MPPSQSNGRAVLAIVAAMGLFVANDGFLKMASATLPVSEAVALRGFFASLGLFVLMAWRGELGFVAGMLRPLIGLRGVIEFAGAFVFISALPFNSLANLTALQQIVPLLMTGFAVLFLRERVAPGRMVAVLAGFAGALMIAQPDASGFSLGSLAALFTAFAVCARDLIARGMLGGVNALALAFITALIVFICTLVLAAIGGFTGWVAPSALRLAQCAGAGLFVGFAHLAIVLAMRQSEVRIVAPFYYSQTLFGLIYSWFVFDDRPNGLALAGMALIVGAGLYVVTGSREPPHELEAG